MRPEYPLAFINRIYTIYGLYILLQHHIWIIILILQEITQPEKRQ